MAVENCLLTIMLPRITITVMDANGETLADGKDRNRAPESQHPGGKMLRDGPESLTEAELLAILISSGMKGGSAEAIGKEIISRFQSLRGLTEQSIEELTRIKGLGNVKACRIAAAFEIARRVVNEILQEDHGSDERMNLDGKAKNQQSL